MASSKRLLVGGNLMFAVYAGLLLFPSAAAAQEVVPCPTPSTCQRAVLAKVVVIDQVLTFNRLGSELTTGMIFALKRDVVGPNGKSCDDPGSNCSPGTVKLRDGKRPRPIVLRVNLGDCLDVELTNLLKVQSVFTAMHIMGMELRSNITSDASWVGRNASSLTPPTATYHYFAKEEGTFFLYSQDDGGTNGQQQSGLFGSINVEPEGAEYYRSQVTKEILDKATQHSGAGPANNSPSMARLLRDTAPVNGQYLTPDKHPIINYGAVDADGTPILQMTRSLATAVVPPQLELIATDLTAIITGPQAGWFPNNNCSPTFLTNGIAYPERRRPYREFSIHYHNLKNAVDPFQSFEKGLSANLNSVLEAGNDQFGINYGIAGIGPEVLANRLGVGPEADCVECKFEEFFLSAWTVGDPAMVVDVPANSGTKTKIATKAFYPDDPSNVYHSYLRDHVKFRIHNAATQAHVHHQHAHQWLHTPDDDNSEYLDSQMIVPGSSYTLEIAYGGSGNRNLTAGDSIFHCHFYPHFAQGMWSMWRVHDTFEAGTELSGGIPVNGARALPDGEIVSGTPIPAIVPLPAQAMAPLPAKIKLSSDGHRVEVLPDPSGAIRNPGYPFFVPGVSGHRPPHPPCDFAWEGGDQHDSLCEKPATAHNNYDGGLPRHLVLGGEVVREFHTRWDFTKDFIRYDDQKKPVAGYLKAFQLPEEGTLVERAAMTQHSQCDIPSFLPDGKPGNFRMNGLPGVPGAPFANPDTDPNCNASHYQVRHYKAAVLQTDTILNKKGWHSPQQRMITLWGDVLPTLAGTRPPQPFFFRANSAESIEFWHTNLVPSYYELDDFQVRTPTDILGQHIHLVKFDVLASDGAANGFNYEDGTLSPDDVRDRIQAVNQVNGLFAFDAKTQFIDPDPKNQTKLNPKPPPREICGEPGKPCPTEWMGAQATIQRWSSDTLQNNSGVDRTLRTVFTHDHFGPSTHQQVGLYAGLLVEPSCSRWFDPITGEQMYTRPDGGPTSWQAMIATYKNCPESGGGPDGPVLDSYREFALEFQDVQLAYTRNSISKPSAEQFSHSVLFNNVFSAADWTTVLADLNGGKVNPKLADQFTQNGIVFKTAQAQVTTITPKKAWAVQVTDPAHPAQPDKQQKYRVDLLPPTGVNVFSSNITPGWTSSPYAISPSSDSTNVPNGPPYPTLVTTSGTIGTYSLSYRSEPIPTRVDPNPATKDTSVTGAALQQAGDMSYVFASIPRVDKDLNQQPTPGAPIDAGQPNGFKFPAILTPGMQPLDPYTPLLRAYQNDKVQIRTLVGAHINGHSFQGLGFKWPFEPRADWTAGTSGYRSAQGMGLSEHFEMLFQVPPSPATVPAADYLYQASSEFAGLENGLWGMLRAYNGKGGTSLQPDLKPLPTNLSGSGTPVATCPTLPPGDKTLKVFNIVAVNAAKALGGPLVYNSRGGGGDADPDAVMYVLATDLSSGGTLNSGVPIEPLILRANAGDCIEVHVTSQLTGAAVQNPVPPNAAQPFAPNPSLFSATVTAQITASYVAALNKGTVPTGLAATFKSFGFPLASPSVKGTASPWTITSGKIVYTLGQSTNTFTANTTPVPPYVSLGTPVSTTAGLHAQLLSYDATQSNGVNVGFNPVQTTSPNAKETVYRWYAGDIQMGTDGPHWIPVEFGSVPLTPADSLIQRERGMIGALIIEPLGSTTALDSGTRASATITKPDASTFREFVAVMQDDVEPGSGFAVNYRMEDGNARPNPPSNNYNFFSNCGISPAADPQTPIFTASDPKQRVRVRIVFPGGSVPQVLSMHGHVWQEEPYISNRQGIPTEIGNNPVSERLGSQQISPNEHIDMVLESAGGAFGVTGDYQYGAFMNGYGGLWGLMRVGQPQAQPSCSSTQPTTAAAKASALEVVAPTRVSPAKKK